jgi:adenylate kinase family enzyme
MDTFEQTTAKVLEKYEAIGKVMRVNGDDNMENVASNLKETLHRRGIVLREKTRS